MIKYWDYLSEYKFLKTKISYTVNKVFESGTLLFGKELKNFEKNFCKYNNSKYGLGVGNGTDALYIALKSLDIGIGDEVITDSILQKTRRRFNWLLLNLLTALLATWVISKFGATIEQMVALAFLIFAKLSLKLPVLL